MGEHHIRAVIGGGVIVITAPTRCQVSLGNLAGVFLSRHSQEFAVDIITGNIKKIYLHYLFAGLGSAIITSNFGVKKHDRVRSVLKYACITAFVMGASFFAIVVCFPDSVLRIYMNTTEEILKVGPEIVRIYSFAYLLMGMNIVASYYFQALKQSRNALIISLLRGFAVCLILMFLLPAIAGFGAIWLTMPLTELLTLFFVFTLLRKKGSRNA